LLLVGKLISQGVNAVRPGRLVFVRDSITGVQFLADSGAVVSMLPPSSSPSTTASTSSSSSTSPLPSLTGVNGAPISTSGERRLRFALDFNGGQQPFAWDFVVGQVSFPILGADFLNKHRLLVDVAGGCLRQTDSGRIFNGELAFSSHTAVAAALPAGIASLLNRFPAVVNKEQSLPKSSHGVEHFLETSGPPVHSRFRRLDTEKLRDAKRIFGEWERQGVVRRSSSSWSSPLHMVRKKDGNWRPCGDFRRLNMATTDDKYPVPNLSDCMANLEGSTVFSTLDLRNGYLQVPLNSAAIPKTAVITPFGLYEFLRMPFGLKNAGMTFQRLMDRVMNGLEFVVVYIDDILVASPDFSSHLLHLETVFQRLSDFGLVLNLDKCEFAKSSVEFLGHKVSAAGCAPLPSKVAAVRAHPQPTTVKELQRFLGMTNFYRKFLPSAAKLLSPLTDTLRGSPPGSQKLTWTKPMEISFAAAKEALANAANLSHPSPTAELAVVADASATHVGAALQQRRQGSQHWEPLSFFSRKLDKPQLSYSAFDRELFAAFAAVRHFRFQLEGRSFQLWTDHKPLTFAINRVSDAWSPRQQRQLAYLAEFTADIRHVAGASNVVADSLSRPPAAEKRSAEPPAALIRTQPPAVAGVSSPPPQSALQPPPPRSSQQSHPPFSAGPPAVSPAEQPPAVAGIRPSPSADLTAIADAQQYCPDTIRFAAQHPSTTKHLQFGDKTLICDSSTGVLRPLVPAAFRHQIFTATHSLAHPGVRACRRLITSRWVWPKMSTNIAGWCKDCQFCQRGKTTRQFTASPLPIAVPSRRFSHIHTDLVGPLPTSPEGFNYLMTIIDRSTRWLEAVPLSSTTAAACADALVAGWISRFGVPDNLTSDRGPQFTSQLWSALTSRLGITHHLTTAFHPQSNGMVERAHRQLKDSLKARAAGTDWPSHLPWILLGLRSAPKDDSGLSSAELLYGAPLSLPGQPPTADESPPSSFVEFSPPELRHLPTRHRSYAEVASSVPAALQKADFVYVKRGGVTPPLAAPYSGPYRILSRSPKSYVIDVGGRHEAVSVDRLKPHSGPSPLVAAQPPKRGRPAAHQSAASPPAGQPPGRG